METIKVYSPIDDKKIKTDLNNSPIWKSAYHAEELSGAKLKHAEMYEYSIKFDGTKPVQFNGVKKLPK